MIRLVNVELINCIIEGKKYDYERYNFEERTPFSTKETSVTVDFGDNKIFGDRIAYGEWGNIELDECIKFLKTLKPNEIYRDFSSLINLYDEQKTEARS